MFKSSFDRCVTKKFVVCDILFRVAFCWVNSPNCAGNFIESDVKKNTLGVVGKKKILSFNHKIEVLSTYHHQTC